jgi:hypothetical protein
LKLYFNWLITYFLNLTGGPGDWKTGRLSFLCIFFLNVYP